MPTAWTGRSFLDQVTRLHPPEAGFITAQILAVDGGPKGYIGHGG
jgi:hypothetical protein